MNARKMLLSLAAIAAIMVTSGCGGVKENAQTSSTPQPSTTNDSASKTPVATAPSTPATSTPTPPTAPTTSTPDYGAKSPAQSTPATPAPTTPTAPETNTPAKSPTESVPTAPPAAPQMPSGPITFSPLESGINSGITARQVILIRDEATWANHWQLHASHNIPVPAAPKVDFSRDSILAVYMGQQNTGGYAVAVRSVTFEQGRLTVTVQQTKPAPDAMTIMVLTQPYQLVRLPRIPGDVHVEVIWQ